MKVITVMIRFVMIGFVVTLLAACMGYAFGYFVWMLVSGFAGWPETPIGYICGVGAGAAVAVMIWLDLLEEREWRD